MDKKKITLSEYDRAWCNKILAELLKNPLTLPFRNPVNVERDKAPDYYSIIKKPMSFSVIKKKLIAGEYKSVKEFGNDVNLIAQNAIKYNGENSMFGYMAQDIAIWVDKKIQGKPQNNDEEWRLHLTQVVQKLRSHIDNAPPSITNPPSPLP